MMTVSEVSRLTGVSIRTLQYYDKIGLLHPSRYTEAGYRLYDDTALAVLQQILLFRELEFSLKDIRRIMTQPGFDREKALTQQIELLTLKKQRLENLIDLARRGCSRQEEPQWILPHLIRQKRKNTPARLGRRGVQRRSTRNLKEKAPNAPRRKTIQSTLS